MMPTLSRNEKLILRASERQDTFLEKFHAPRKNSQETDEKVLPSTFYIPGDENGTSTKEGHDDNGVPNPYSDPAIRAPSPTPSAGSSSSSNASSLLDNEPWTREDGDDTEVPLSQKPPEAEEEVLQPLSEDKFLPEKAFLNEDPSASIASDQRSRSSKATRSTRHRRNGSWGIAATTESSESDHRSQPKNFDTHFYPALLSLDTIDLPLKIPIYTFPGEVGTVRLRLSDKKREILTATQVLHQDFMSSALTSHSINFRATPPSSSLQWRSHSSYNTPLQRTNNS